MRVRAARSEGGDAARRRAAIVTGAPDRTVDHGQDRPSGMTEEQAQHRWRRWARWVTRGALAVVAIGFIVVVALVIIGLFYDSADEDSGVAGGLNVGPAAEYARSDVNHFDLDHVFLVRYPDGSFDAFYDKSARQQELNGSCRILFDENALVGALEQFEGMRGAFVEACDDQCSVWRVDGTFSFGNSYGDMDRFETRIDGAGDLIIDTSQRTCTRSKGVPGIPPFETTTCDGAP